MAADIIKMNYPMMEDMANTFQQSADQIEATIGEINNIVGMIDGGGLLGMAGDMYVEACSAMLVPALTKLQEKTLELKGDVIGAMEDMKGSDDQTTRMYG